MSSDPIPIGQRLRADERLRVGDFWGSPCTINDKSLELVVKNCQPLQAYNQYELALLDAYTDSKSDSYRWPLIRLWRMFAYADRENLLAAGDPLPHDERFTLYRGVAGQGTARRIRGFAWSGSRDTAEWFAKRHRLEDPAVYELTIDAADVLAYRKTTNEFLILVRGTMKPVRIA
jgi:hypothetical protein